MDLSRKSVLNEVLWSDPTDSDERVGCHPNARGPNTVSYGPDRVKAFCAANGLKLIMRAHQCAPGGVEWCTPCMHTHARASPHVHGTCMACARRCVQDGFEWCAHGQLLTISSLIAC